jgi:class 3 adenylate cyclase
VEAALEMIEMIELFNVDQESAGLMPIKIGIGIATGSVIAGFTGTLRRATYTCVGDAVNQASRLEGLTKDVGQPILINETTRQALGDEIPVIDHGIVPIRGKQEEVRVYSVPVANS